MYIYLYYSYIYLKKNKKYYTEIIPEITRVVFLEKREVTNIIRKYKVISDSMNNYMIKMKKTNTRLNDIFDDVLNKVKIKVIPLDILLSINYFKSELTILLKYITYYIITQIHQVFITATNIFNDVLSISEIINGLNDLKCENLLLLIDEFKGQAYDIVRDIKN